jgi:DNA-binding GntR family transcriptional regulator
LSDQVKEYIIQAILNGEFQPGDRIVESALARELGVSQAPVREAIRDLVLLGFLETEPYKGTRVRSFTPEELYEVYIVRAALESVAARQAATRITEDDFDELRAILDEMIETGKQGDYRETSRLNVAFHEVIMQASGNKLLYQLWKNIEFARWTVVTSLRSYLPLEDLARRHEILLEALLSRDPETAMKAMQHHIEDLGKPGMLSIGGDGSRVGSEDASG